MSQFTVQRKQVLPVLSGEWETLYDSDEETKARVRFNKSLSILRPGWRIQLLDRQTVLEDKTVPIASTSLSPDQTTSSGGCIPGVEVYENWIFPDDEDYPVIPDRTC